MSRNKSDGFTLVEMLIAVSITGIIGSILAGVVRLGYLTYADTTTRLNESNDRQQIAVYFTRDVQSAGTLALSGGTCGTASGTTIARFTWNEADSSATPVVTPREVTYRLAAGTAPANGALSRVLCVNNAVADTTIVGRWVSPGASASAQCLTAALAVDGTCASASTDRGMRLTVTESGGPFSVDGVKRTE